jgi:uncharacterized membrane protein
MNGLGAFLAQRLGLDPAEFDRWQFLWGRTPAGWPLAVVAAALVIFLFLSWRAGRTVDKTWQRGFLLALRAGVALLIAALVFDPAVEFLKTRKREESFAVLVDVSRSMTLKTARGEERAELVRQHLKESAAVLDALEKRYKVSYLTFDATARPATREEAAARKATGNQSYIGESIDDIIRAMAADPPAGIVLYSDGADRGRIRAALDGEGALAPVPVYPVLLPTETPPDAAVAEVVTDPYAFIRNGFDVRAKIEVRGLKVAAVDVTLKVDGQVVATQNVAIPKEGGPVEALFRTTPQRVGRFVYSVEIPHFAGEAITENNRRNAIVKVVRDRLRVLQVVGEPSWDERFLRRYLEKDPNVDLISFMILRTREDLDMTPESELSLIPFPTKELFTDELKTFDLVIFQNFDYRPYFEMFPGQLLDNIRRFVEQDGGGFLMIGGDKSFSHGGYVNTPIAEILPVDLPPTPNVDPEPVRPELAEEALRHPVTGLDLPSEETKAVWKQFPPLEGVNIVGGLRPGGIALMRHPLRKIPGGGAMPVLAVMEAGKGRSMALTSDASWLWNFQVAGDGGSAAYYQRFWNNAIRWLVHDPDFGRVRLEADRDHYDPGEAMKARCAVFDENYKPAAKATVEMQIRERERQTGWKTLPAQEIETGVHAAEHQPQGGGVYEIKCSARTDGKKAGEDTVLADVDRLGEELQRTAVDNGLLSALAKRSGGQTIALGDSDWGDAVGLGAEAAFEIVGRQVARIWDNAMVLSVLALLLSLEWFLRRRWGGL